MTNTVLAGCGSVRDGAGAQYGSQMLPRIGQEVIVELLRGDPDQPIITGRTYHSTTEPPYPLPKHKNADDDKIENA